MAIQTSGGKSVKDNIVAMWMGLAQETGRWGLLCLRGAREHNTQADILAVHIRETTLACLTLRGRQRHLYVIRSGTNNTIDKDTQTKPNTIHFHGGSDWK
jgi:hypothetical protein